MDKVASQSSNQVDPHSAAASLQDDFEKLVRIFERELAKIRVDAKARPHLTEAKDAAERGLELSKQLAGLLLQGD